MSLLVNALIGFLAYLLSHYIFERLMVVEPVAFILAVVIGIVVALSEPLGRFNR